MFECVINISEGRDATSLHELASAASSSLRDVHADPYHHRAVFTLIDPPGPLVAHAHALIGAAYRLLDLTGHEGVHPRFGVVDVVPFVALDPARAGEALTLRDDLARWLAETYRVPVFLYGALGDGTTRSLPDVRRGAFTSLAPDFGPATAPPSLGAVAVGARTVLVAWNLWLRDTSLDEARVIARSLRRPALRTLAFELGDRVQVSCNIVDTAALAPSQVYDEVAAMLTGGAIERCELVGLVPASLLEREDPARWAQLGLSAEATIEARTAP